MITLRIIAIAALVLNFWPFVYAAIEGHWSAWLHGAVIVCVFAAIVTTAESETRGRV